MNLVIDDTCYAYNKIFAEFGHITALPGRDIAADNVKNADILIVRSRTQVNADLLAGSSVKFVGSAVAGLDHIDQNYLKTQNIRFFSAQGCNALAVAEFVISLIINLSFDLNFDYTQKTLGIIGVGNVGSRLNRLAQQFNIQTLLNDPMRQESEILPNFVDLNTALQADIVTFHTPLTKTGKHPTHYLLNSANFHNISPNTILINAARGGVIDEKIWQKTKTLANVIDCWENEPGINQALQNNAYLATPHIAGHSIDAKFKGSLMIYEALCQFLHHQPNPAIQNLVNPEQRNIEHHNLKDTLQTIYNFKQDALAIQDLDNFEHYRRHYPSRYEWKHFNTCITLPSL
jgi:erythronate-4-phosphate dehydrogenase